MRTTLAPSRSQHRHTTLFFSCIHHDLLCFLPNGSAALSSPLSSSCISSPAVVCIRFHLSLCSFTQLRRQRLPQELPPRSCTLNKPDKVYAKETQVLYVRRTSKGSPVDFDNPSAFCRVDMRHGKNKLHLPSTTANTQQCDWYYHLGWLISLLTAAQPSQAAGQNVHTAARFFRHSGDYT